MTEAQVTGYREINEDLINLEGRHPSTQHMMRWLTPNPNLKGLPAAIAEECETLAATMVANITQDSPELTAGLRKLLEAKDCFVRASVDEPALSWTDR